MKTLIARLSGAIYDWATKPPVALAVYEAAVIAACVDAGLNRAELEPLFNVVETGKLHIVLRHASVRLQITDPLVTVRDITQHLLRLAA